MPAKITVVSQEKPLQIARADMTKTPVKQIGQLVEMPAGMTMEFVVNSAQGLVIREKP